MPYIERPRAGENLVGQDQRRFGPERGCGVETYCREQQPEGSFYSIGPDDKDDQGRIEWEGDYTKKGDFLFRLPIVKSGS